MSATTGLTGDDIRDGAIKNVHVSLTAAIQEAKLLFDIISGHNHDGLNSRFVAGGGGPTNLVVDSSFAGAVDGVNAVFTLPLSFQPNTVAAYVGGIRQKRGTNFTETAVNQVTFSSPPSTGSILVFDFVAA